MSDRPSKTNRRKAIGKRLRFDVFSRDGFSCRYCGSQSDKVQLVVDHVVPVCQGGTNEIENLITSCFACNAGKGGRTVEQSVPNESHRLALAQEMQEQLAAIASAKAAQAARSALRQEVVNYYCEARGQDSMCKDTCSVLNSYVEQYGPSVVFGWIDIAVARLPHGCNDRTMGKYISGIRRKWLEETNA